MEPPKRMIMGYLFSEEVNCYICKKKIETALNVEMMLIVHPHGIVETRGYLCDKCLRIFKRFLRKTRKTQRFTDNNRMEQSKGKLRKWIENWKNRRKSNKNINTNKILKKREKEGFK